MQLKLLLKHNMNNHNKSKKLEKKRNRKMGLILLNHLGWLNRHDVFVVVVAADARV